MRTPSRVTNQPQHHSSSNQQHDGNTDGQPGLVPHPPGQLVFQVPTAGENTRFTDSPGFNSADSGDNVEYSSPQRVVYQTSQPPGKQFPLSRKDVLSLLERSDLSSNIEIIRIKNELARLKNALSQDNRRTPSPK